MFTLLVLVEASLLKAQGKIGKQGWGTEPLQTRFMNKAAVLASVFIYWKSLDKEAWDSVTYT